MGGLVTILGNNFGPTTSQNVVLFNGKQCPVQTANATQLTIQAPPGTGASLALQIDVLGQQYFATGSYLAPLIDAISTTSPTSGGLVEISGENFGNSSSAVTVLVGSATNRCTVLEDSTLISCTVPPGAGNAAVQVKVSGQASGQNIYHIYDVPNITSVTNVSTSGGTISIFGTNFGPLLSSVSVSLGGSLCASLNMSVPHKVLTCRVGAGTQKIDVLVNVSGYTSTLPGATIYAGPSVSSISRVSTTGGLLVITGNNFGANATGVFIDICTNITMTVPHKTINCIKEEGTGSFSGKLATASGAANFVARYADPTITTVSPVNTTGGLVSLVGSNFGSNTSTLILTFDGKSTNFVLANDSNLNFQILPGIGGPLQIVLNVSGNMGYWSFYYQAPVVSSTPLHTRAVGGIITINGDNFGNTTTYTIIGNSNCTFIAMLIPHKQFTCMVAPGEGANQSVVVTVGGQSSLRQYIFTYQDVPSPPSSPIRKAYSRSYMTVSWTPPSYNGGFALDFYTLFISAANFSQSLNITFPTNTYTLLGLNMSTAYRFKVISHNAIGYSNASAESLYFTADPFCGDNICDGSESCDSCNLDCAVECSSSCEECGHGTCDRGLCKCESGWAGPSCNTQDTAPINIDPNSTSPVIVVPTSNIQFSISFTSISEIDYSENILISYALQLQNISLNKTENGFHYTITLPNSATLVILIAVYNNTTDIIFANKTISVGANSLKYTMTVANWPFTNLQNKLQIVMSATGNGSTKKNCESTQTSQTGDSNLRWISVNYNGDTLYGTFIEYAQIDQDARNVQFKYTGSNQVAVIIPHFWDRAIFDPSFQVLLGYDSKNCNTKHKNIAGKVVGGVVGAVVGVACIVGAGLYWKFHQKRKRLYRMNSSGPLTSSPSKDVEME
eukprot:Phypoly_transcript_01655.p1 GENE.Phypoly_transcript_01655~~Phypoly_transcript_01655.p1  ORF type:complete len:1042 (+),score=102.30 Phypoly_transcript_01655:424-3126(+)